MPLARARITSARFSTMRWAWRYGIISIATAFTRQKICYAQRPYRSRRLRCGWALKILATSAAYSTNIAVVHPELFASRCVRPVDSHGRYATPCFVNFLILHADRPPSNWHQNVFHSILAPHTRPWGRVRADKSLAG